MSRFVDLLCSPKIALFVFVPLMAYYLADGCSISKSPLKRRG